MKRFNYSMNWTCLLLHATANSEVNNEHNLFNRVYRIADCCAWSSLWLLRDCRNKVIKCEESLIVFKNFCEMTNYPKKYIVYNTIRSIVL